MADATKPQNPPVRKPLTQERLKEVLHYNPDTGVFTRLLRNRHARKFGAVGTVLGSLKASGYIFIDIDGCRYRAHRLAWLYMTGAFPDFQIDHENNNRSANWWSNLRPATNQQNQANSRCSSNNKTGFKGVYWSKSHGKYAAKINPDRRQIHLGVFESPEDAHEAYAVAAKKYFGEFGRAA